MPNKIYDLYKAIDKKFTREAYKYAPKAEVFNIAFGIVFLLALLVLCIGQLVLVTEGYLHPIYSLLTSALTLFLTIRFEKYATKSYNKSLCAICAEFEKEIEIKRPEE